MKKSFLFLKSQGIVLIALIGAIIFILFSIINYNIQVNRFIHMDMRSQVSAIQENSVRLLQNEMDYLKRVTESTAEMMNHTDYSTDADIVQALKDYAQSSKLSRTLFITLDGNVYTSYAGYLGQDDTSKYMDGVVLSEIKSTIFLPLWYSEDIDEVILGVVTPVTLGDKKGVLVSSYDIKQLHSLLKNEFMGGSIEIGVLNRKGDVVLGRQMSEFQLNIFDSYLKNNTRFSNHSAEGMRQDFAKDLTGFSSYFVDDVERYCSYAPVKYNDWYIIVMVQESALRSNLTALEHYGIWLTLELVIIMTVLLLIIIAARQREQKHVRIVLQKAAMLDGLTKIYNRATAESKIAAYLNGEGKQEKHALFIMDIDNFKMFNDSLGHIFGDLVLKELARRLEDVFSEQDIIGRLGGDEFIVLIKKCPDTAYFCERANQMLDGLYVTADTGIEQLVSISLGIAQYDIDGKSFIELYKHADAALYRAKKQGKGRFSF